MYSNKEIIVTDREVQCSGELNDHPLVYYTIGKDGYVVCGYCSQKFIYKESKDWWDKIPHRVREDD